ncbi:MAG: caspase family protein [Candidatus Cloacimonadaceae bacterium]|nr:caspase family protein [Candidatus Cloacimonadaceae bacterium]
MKRKMIIVYCDRTSSGDLAGPSKDASNLRSYFTSKLGGEWYDSEIETLDNPKIAKFRSSLNSIAPDTEYSMLVFSGHGGIDKTTNQQYLELLDGDYCLVDVKMPASRQTIILDTCRSYFIRKSEDLAKFAALLESYDASHPSTRTLYDDYVLRADEGRTVMTSSSPGQASGDSNDGGLYILSLLHSAKNWGSHSGGYSQILDLLQVHELACIYMKKNYLTIQSPMITKDKRRAYFPFAVFK